MAVEMLDPQADQRVIDPACGTGGFLITAMNHALKALREQGATLWNDPDNPTSYEIEELYRKRAEYLSTCVHGMDLNPALVRAAKMNMVRVTTAWEMISKADSLKTEACQLILQQMTQ